MTITFPYKGISKEQFTLKALAYAQSESHFAYYKSNGAEYPYGGFNEILAIGANSVLKPKGNSFQALKSFHDNEWCFGYLGYDLKNELENLSSENRDRTGFNNLEFFKAQSILFFSEDECLIEGDVILEKILISKLDQTVPQFKKPIASVQKEEYIKTVKRLKHHIKEGDCYEINYCQEFHGEIEQANPLNTFLVLNEVSPKPFTCFQKFNKHYILCASPERFIKKEGTKIISQPIKGTRPRGATPDEDLRLKTELRNDEKELAENMMIVDLVRNDLAKTAKTGTVNVEEIFGIYSFEQVHQMISTVTGMQREDKDFIDVIREAFPMGSMTGAPKIKVMELIEEYENTKRVAFSGSSGYITPDGDFDFNVLIRSLFLNTDLNTYSYQVGSAITYDAIAENEYEECLVKARAILKVLAHNNHENK